jgi:acyl carrier protein
MQDTILNYIRTQLLEAGQEIEAEDDMLTSGLIDSMKVMRLIAFVEKEFKMPIPPEDMVIDHFISVTAIEDYLNSRSS